MALGHRHPNGLSRVDLTLSALWSDVKSRHVCRIGNARKTNGQRRRVWGYGRALDRCVIPALLRWLSHPCHRDNNKISTKNKSPSLSVTYNGIENVPSALEQAGGSLCGASTLISKRALSSSSMVIPWAKIWELILSYSFRCA